jgi:hypothetical protein
LYDYDVLHTYPAGKTGSTFTIPNTVTIIEAGAFLNCKSLTSVTIPKSVSFIRELAFSGCTNLTSVTFSTGSAIYSSRFADNSAFPGGYDNLKTAYLAGGAGTYTRTSIFTEDWKKQ